MHLGRGIYIPRQCYDTAKLSAKTSLFVRKICVVIFGIDVLLRSSVGGNTCNKTKSKSEPLDGTKLAAVHGKYGRNICIFINSSPVFFFIYFWLIMLII